jgi:type II secretory pathway component HofQ
MKNISKNFCILALVFPLLLSAETNQELAVYGTLGTDIEIMTATAHALLGEEGNVIPDPKGARLLILTSPEKHAALQKAFEKSMASIQNVQLTVQIQSSEQQNKNNASLSGTITIRPDGARVVAQPSFQYQTREASQNTQQLLVTTSGKEASLQIGEVIPFLDWTIDTARFHPAIYAETRWQEVGAFLTFQPTIQPDGKTIHLKLTPEIRGKAANGDPLGYSITSIQTEIVAQDGQTVEIGNWSDANQLYSSFLIGRSKSNQSKSIVINITPRIL